MRVAAAVVLLLVVAGCGSAHARPTAGAQNVSSKIVPPKTVDAFRMRGWNAAGFHALKLGTRVDGGFSGHRLFSNRSDGFALGCLTATEGCATYPLATTDGGKTWRVAGPIVDVGGAGQAGGYVSTAGAVDARHWFLCCGGDTVADVTPDAGKHWWTAAFPGEVVTVVAGEPSFNARVVAVVRPYGTHQLWIYVSRDGRRWTYDPRLTSIY